MSQTANQPRTIIGPLTTTFTPQPSCSVAMAECAYSCTLAWQAQGCSGNSLFDTTDCWPPASPGVSSPTAPFSGWGFYSPGLYCPAGYTVACSATGGVSSGWPFEYALLPSETAHGCCPTSFTCAYEDGQTCQSFANNYGTAAVATCSNGVTANPTDLTVPYTIGGLSSSNSYEGVTISQYQVLAPLIDIRWQSKDKISLSSTSSSSSAASPATTSGTGSPTPNPVPSGLSTGAQAGIGVGVAVVAIALIVGALFLWRRRKTSGHKQVPTNEPEPGPSRQEVQGNPVYELDDRNGAQNSAQKQSPWNGRHEMQGSEPQLPHLES